MGPFAEGPMGMLAAALSTVPGVAVREQQPSASHATINVQLTVTCRRDGRVLHVGDAPDGLGISFFWPDDSGDDSYVAAGVFTAELCSGQVDDTDLLAMHRRAAQVDDLEDEDVAEDIRDAAKLVAEHFRDNAPSRLAGIAHVLVDLP